MEVTCPGCGRANPEGRSRCAECNASLANARPAGAGGPAPAPKTPAEPPTEKRARAQIWRDAMALDAARAEAAASGVQPPPPRSGTTKIVRARRDPNTGLPLPDPDNPPALDPRVRPKTGQFAVPSLDDPAGATPGARPPTASLGTRPPTGALERPRTTSFRRPDEPASPPAERPVTGTRESAAVPDAAKAALDAVPAPAPAAEPDWEFALPPPFELWPPPDPVPPDISIDAAVKQANTRANIRKGVVDPLSPAHLPPIPPPGPAIPSMGEPPPAAGESTKRMQRPGVAPLPKPGELPAIPAGKTGEFLITSVLGEPYPLSRTRGCRIGRDPDNDIVLALTQVSRKHAVVRVEGSEGFVVTDLGSANGTFVNGRSVRRRRLEDGDRIVIGPFSLIFRSKTGGERKGDKGSGSGLGLLEETDTLSTDSLAGDLNEVPIANLLRFILALGKTGELVLTPPPTASASGRGVIYIRAGRPVHAERGGQKGEEAIMALLKMKQGGFRFSAKPIDIEKATITLDLDTLLLNASLG